MAQVSAARALSWPITSSQAWITAMPVANVVRLPPVVAQ